MLCWSLLWYKVNQLYVHIHPLSLEPPSCPHPGPLGHHRAALLCCRAGPHELCISPMVVCICHSYCSSWSPPPLLTPRSQVCSLRLQNDGLPADRWHGPVITE